MSMPRSLPQSKEALLKSYRTRLKDDVKSMLENFEGIIMMFQHQQLVITNTFCRNCKISKRRTRYSIIKDDSV